MTLSVAISALVGTILLVSYIRNWRYAIPALLIVTIFVVGFSPPKPLFTLDKSLMLFVAPILALLLSRTRWVVFSIVLPFIIFAGRTGLENLPALPSFYTLFTMIAVSYTHLDVYKRQVQMSMIYLICIAFFVRFIHLVYGHRWC